jgi:7-cyano-7-deazaguanine synthase
MDSSLCLAEAIQKFGIENVLSLSFSYGQRHSVELQRAEKICKQWNVDHTVLDISCLNQITENSLTRPSLPILKRPGEAPNSLVVGRNGLMGRIAAIHANQLGAHHIYMGVIEVESSNSGYRDCSRNYINMLEQILRIDLDDESFEIKTPLVKMTKYETMKYGYQMGILRFLLETTISCYEGLDQIGCQKCPACQLRNAGILEFLTFHPDFEFSFKAQILNHEHKAP